MRYFNNQHAMKLVCVTNERCCHYTIVSPSRDFFLRAEAYNYTTIGGWKCILSRPGHPRVELEPVIPTLIDVKLLMLEKIEEELMRIMDINRGFPLEEQWYPEELPRLLQETKVEQSLAQLQRFNDPPRGKGALARATYEHFNTSLKFNWNLECRVSYVESFAHEVAHIYAGSPKAMRTLKEDFENREAPLPDLTDRVEDALVQMSPQSRERSERLALAVSLVVLPRWAPLEACSPTQVLKEAYEEELLATSKEHGWSFDRFRRHILDAVKKYSEVQRVVACVERALEAEYVRFREEMKKL